MSLMEGVKWDIQKQKREPKRFSGPAPLEMQGSWENGVSPHAARGTIEHEKGREVGYAGDEPRSR